MQWSAMKDMVVVDGPEVPKLISMAECIDIVDGVMRDLSRGNAVAPLRTGMPLPNGRDRLGLMPGYDSISGHFGIKLMCLFPANPAQGLPSHSGLIAVFNAGTGMVDGILDATAVTALRTAAASAVATRALARADAGDLAILGTGHQALAHIRAMADVRTLRRVRIWGRTPEKAGAVARDATAMLGFRCESLDSVQDAVAGADLVCTVSAAREPILEGRWIAPGAHVNLVGSSIPSAREVDDALLSMGRLVVDYLPSVREFAGEIRHAIANGAIAEDHVIGEIGAILDGSIAFDRLTGDITIYKSLGVAPQDIAVAADILRRLRARAG